MIWKKSLTADVLGGRSRDAVLEGLKAAGTGG